MWRWVQTLNPKPKRRNAYIQMKTSLHEQWMSNHMDKIYGIGIVLEAYYLIIKTENIIML
jgi:hypothetical protein